MRGITFGHDFHCIESHVRVSYKILREGCFQPFLTIKYSLDFIVSALSLSSILDRALRRIKLVSYTILALILQQQNSSDGHVAQNPFEENN